MIYVVRHGETDWNAQNKLQGKTDIPLNENGINSAKILMKELEDVEFDFVFSSPLKRAKETCRIIINNNKAIVFDDRLVERNHGELEGKHKNEFDKHRLWSLTESSPYESVETLDALRFRIYGFLDSLKTHKDKNILIVSHAGAIRIMTEYFKGKPSTNNLLEYTVENCEVLKFSWLC